MRLPIIISVFIMALLARGSAYATCNSNIPLSKPISIYVVQGDGTSVIDAETGLMWQQCSLGLSDATCSTGVASTYTWKAALEAAQTANVGAGTFGFKDWRLPSVAELRTLAEKACSSPAINETVFPFTLSNYYWTASTYAPIENSAWFVHFGLGMEDALNKNNTYYVRLVRGH